MYVIQDNIIVIKYIAPVEFGVQLIEQNQTAN